jgi:hypothetical protein
VARLAVLDRFWRQAEVVTTGRSGRVEHRDVGLCWRVFFPDHEHEAASSYLREL